MFGIYQDAQDAKRFVSYSKRIYKDGCSYLHVVVEILIQTLHQYHHQPVCKECHTIINTCFFYKEQKFLVWYFSLELRNLFFTKKHLYIPKGKFTSEILK